MQIDYTQLEQYTGHDVILEQQSTGIRIKIRLCSTHPVYSSKEYVYGVGMGINPEKGRLIYYTFKKGEPIKDTNIYLLNQ